MLGESSISPILFVLQKKYGNNTYYKMLVQLPVELLPPSIDNCGNQFNDASMACGIDNDENKVGLYEPEFCMVSVYLSKRSVRAQYSMGMPRLFSDRHA